jgi:uncharacterized membrane protein
MGDFLGSNTAALVVLLAITAALVAVGVYVIIKVRGQNEEAVPSASDLLTNFRELHGQGELSDEEYRTIKAVLAEKLQDEIADGGQQG